jgi:hypothetical protein
MQAYLPTYPLEMTYLHLFLYSSLNGCYEGIEHGESTLQWSKNVVKNYCFSNYATFNFHQINIKRDFQNYT